jgi:hypothetical protein
MKLKLAPKAAMSIGLSCRVHLLICFVPRMSCLPHLIDGTNEDLAIRNRDTEQRDKAG